MLSQFLPGTYDPTEPLAVIAGRGVYPSLSVAALRHSGIPTRLIAFTGETEPDLIDSFPPEDCRILKVGQLGKLLDTLKDWQVRYALMAGQIAPRRLFRGLHPDLKAMRILLQAKERNAASLFGAVRRHIEQQGVTVLDARAFLDDQLATAGMMTGGRLPKDRDARRHGMRMAKSIAGLDIGQGVVVRKGTVLAVEAFDGTDAMLRRCRDYQVDGMIFVKVAKPNQDYRFDVPCFGRRTLESMRIAGIKLACLEVGRILILEKHATLAQARDWGITLLGEEEKRD